MLRLLVVLAAAALTAVVLVPPALDAPQLTLSHIYSIRPDGTGAYQVTGAAADDFAPAPSPDGHRLAFERVGSERSGLWVVGVHGGDAGKVAELGINHFPARPTWSPNGNTLAFDDADYLTCTTQLPCPIRQVRKVSGDGTGEAVVAEPTVATRGAAGPTWSPSGQQLAFVGLVNAEGGAGAIEVARVDGGGRHEVLSESAASCPAWAPDGKWIAYVGSAGSGALRLVSPDGGASRRLHSARCGFAWSPKGKRLAFVDRGWLYVIGVTGDGLRRLTRASEDALSWSPHGDAIAFAYGHKLVVVRVRNRGRRTLMRACVGDPAWSSTNRIYFTLTAPC